MTAFHWFLPTTGDSRSLVGGGHSITPGIAQRGSGAHTAGRFRDPDIAYLAEVARTAERLGFEAVLTPTGTPCEEAWVIASALIRETEKLKFLIALRPGLISPTLLAQMASTFQRISDNRLLLNVVVGGEADEQARFGDRIAKDDRYRRAGEFLEVFRGALTPEGITHRGEYYDVANARTRQAPSVVPPIYLGGSSAAAGPVAADQVDVYLTWGERPDAVAEKIRWISELASAQGRTVRFGIRLHIITRDRSEDAWQVADRLLADLDPAEVAKAQAVLAASQSEGQARMRELHGGRVGGSARDLEIHPGLWAGVGLVRSGAGTALVGSHHEVADLIGQYRELGIEEFVLSGYPHIEEAYWFAEGVLPLLRSS